MVTDQDILDANALINDSNGPQVAVFVGGTAGIGKLTIEAIVKTNISTRIYLVGRKSSYEKSATFINEMKIINSKADIIWIEGEISLMAENRRICDIIKEKESKIDLLFMTAGYAPFKGRELTEEGLEVAQALEYYSRMLFTLQLLPLLERSEHAKVISVLGGGLERAKMDVDDINFEKPGNFSGMKSQPQYGAMNTLFLDRLAAKHPEVTFIHSWPGWINTGNVKRSAHPYSFAGWMFWLIIEPIIYLFAIDNEVARQRYLFLSTSAYVGGKGTPWKGKLGLNASEKEDGAVFLTNYKANCTPNAKNVKDLRKQAQDKVWDKTHEVLLPFMS